MLVEAPPLLSPLPVLHTRHQGLNRQPHQRARHNRQADQKSRKSQTKSSEAQRQLALHVTALQGVLGFRHFAQVSLFYCRHTGISALLPGVFIQLCTFNFVSKPDTSALIRYLIVVLFVILLLWQLRAASPQIEWKSRMSEEADRWKSPRQILNERVASQKREGPPNALSEWMMLGLYQRTYV